MHKPDTGTSRIDFSLARNEVWTFEVLRSLKPVWIRPGTVSGRILGIKDKNIEDPRIKLSDREQLSLQHLNLPQCQSGTKLI